jgi:predicted exporter
MSWSSRGLIGGWIAFVLACIAVISRAEISTDLSAFLPRSPTPAQQLLVDQLREGVVSRQILIGIEGGTTEALAGISRRMAGELRRDASFVAVNNGENVGLEKDREYLWHNRYLLSPAVDSEHFTAAALRRALEDDLQLLSSSAGMLTRKILAQDPSGELLRLLDQLEGQAKPAMRHGVWFSKDDKRAVMVVQTRSAGYDIDAQQSALARIRAAFADVAAGAGTTRLLVSGPGVFSVSARETIKRDVLRFALIATTLVSGLLLLLYRSATILGLALLPVASGALAGLAAVSLGFGSVHGITLGFGVTLIGEGVDYAIYLFTQLTPGTAAGNTLDRIWPTLRLGVLTSVCGFSAMLFSGFPGLAQLGLFSITGLIVAAAVTRGVLPALLRSGFSARAVTALAPKAAVLAQRAPALRPALLFGVALATLFLLLQRGPSWNDDLARLSPIPLREQALDAQLRRDLGAPDVRYLVVISPRGQEAALQASEDVGALLRRLAGAGILEGFESPATYLPSRRMQRARQAALPSADKMRENLEQAQRGLPFRPGLFLPFLDDVSKAKRQPPLSRADLQGTNLATEVDALLVRRPTGWAAMLPLRGVADAASIARQVSAVPGAGAVLLDLKRDADRLYQSYRYEVLKYSLLGAAAIVVLLFASLRAAGRVFDVVAPLAAAVIVTSGGVMLNGHGLSIFNLIGLLLVVAVGSNYSLFFDRRLDSGPERERTIVSLMFANLSTVIGFGVLTFSNVPVLSAIGSTVGIGAALSLVFAAILARPDDLAAGAGLARGE